MKRCRHDIYGDILRRCIKGSIISTITKKCKLSYTQVSEYLSTLQEQGHIQKSLERRKDTRGCPRLVKVYYTTEKGKLLLKLINSFPHTNETLEKLVLKQFPASFLGDVYDNACV